MTVSIKEHFKHHTAQESIELKRIMESVRTVLETHATAIAGITAQLDADVGVNDVTYASGNDPADPDLIA